MAKALRKIARFVLPVALVGSALLCASAQPAAQTRRPERYVTGLTDSVYSIQFSPDSRTLAMARGARGPGRLELWDVETGKLKRVIRGFDGVVWSVSFAPDGKTIITGSGGSRTDTLPARHSRRFTELKWWDVETGELKRQMEMTGDRRLSVEAFYSPDGKSLATIEYSATISTLVPGFESASGNRLPGYPFTFRTYTTYSADLRLRDARTGEVVLKLKGGLANLATMYDRSLYGSGGMSDEALSFAWRYRRLPLAFSPDGQIVANWNQRELRLWNGSSGEEMRKLKDFRGRLSAAAFSPHSRFLAAGITRVSIKNDKRFFRSQALIYDMSTGEMTKTLDLATDAISSLAFSPNGNQLLVGGSRYSADRSTGTVELVSIQKGSLGGAYIDEEEGVQSLLLSPNARIVALQTSPSTVKLLDTLTWEVKRTFDDTSDPESDKEIGRSRILSLQSVPAIAFSSDGKTVTGGIEQDGVKLWDVRTGEVKKQLAVDEDSGSIMAISANGTIVGEVGADETLRLWNMTLGEEKTVLTSGGPVSALALSSDGITMAVGYPNRIVLLNTFTGEPVQTLKGQQSQSTKINCMVFSADGRALASSEDGRVEIWDLATGQIRKTIEPSGTVTALRFAADGRTLASGSQDGSVSLWDLQTGILSLQLRKHTAAVNAIAFSTAGDLMATGGDDSRVIIWETGTGKARRTLKGHDLAVTSLAFSPDANLLACGSGNASVVLWDVQTGKLNRVLR